MHLSLHCKIFSENYFKNSLTATISGHRRATDGNVMQGHEIIVVITLSDLEALLLLYSTANKRAVLVQIPTVISSKWYSDIRCGFVDEVMPFSV